MTLLSLTDNFPGFCPNKPTARRVSGDHGFLYIDDTKRSFADAEAACQTEGGSIITVKDLTTVHHALDLVTDNNGMRILLRKSLQKTTTLSISALRHYHNTWYGLKNTNDISCVDAACESAALSWPDGSSFSSDDLNGKITIQAGRECTILKTFSEQLDRVHSWPCANVVALPPCQFQCN